MLSSVNNRKETSGSNGAQINDLCVQLQSFEMEGETLIDDIVTDCLYNPGQSGYRIDPEIVYSKDVDGDTLLHVAIIIMDIKLSMFCISQAVSNKWLSCKNQLFQSPLHLAVLTNQIEVTRRLVVGGADVESRDNNGNTALHLACREGYHEIAKCLLEPVRYLETKQNTYEIPYQKIPQDFGIKNYEGLTCLHLAAMNKHNNIVELLINKGIDLNFKEGKAGRTVLHNACIDGDASLVKLLLRERSCDINARAYDGSTPFDFARARKHERICVSLAAAGARFGEEYLDSDE